MREYVLVLLYSTPLYIDGLVFCFSYTNAPILYTFMWATLLHPHNSLLGISPIVWPPSDAASQPPASVTRKTPSTSLNIPPKNNPSINTYPQQHVSTQRELKRNDRRKRPTSQPPPPLHTMKRLLQILNRAPVLLPSAARVSPVEMVERTVAPGQQEGGGEVDVGGLLAGEEGAAAG